MIEISLAGLAHVAGFVLAWAVMYACTVLVRFGDDLTWKSEFIAGAVTFIVAMIGFLIYTGVLKFV